MYFFNVGSNLECNNTLLHSPEVAGLGVAVAPAVGDAAMTVAMDAAGITPISFSLHYHFMQLETEDINETLWLCIQLSTFNFPLAYGELLG